MPSLSNNNSDIQEIQFTKHFVEIREAWGDDWEFTPYLRATSPCKRAAQPEGSEAHFRFEFGNKKEGDETIFEDVEPLDIRDYFVRISLQGEDDPQPVWYGIITEDTREYDSRRVSGVQTFTAYGLEHLMKKQLIGQTVVRETNSLFNVTDQFLYLDKVETFNRHPQKGHQLKGNRTTNQTEANCHAFSSDGEQWTNYDILQYLLNMTNANGDLQFLPDIGATWQLTGQTDALKSLKKFFHFDKTDVLHALNQLIDRKQGMGFIVWPDDDDNINIDVFTICDFPVQVGEVTLPANDNPIQLTLPQQFPDTLLLDTIPFRTSATNEYSEIRVRSAPIQMVGQWDFGGHVSSGGGSGGTGSPDGPTPTLVIGWSQDHEDDYKLAQGNGDGDANDIYRQKEIFKHVFRSLVVDPSWDGTIDSANVLPIPLEDGTVSTDVNDLPNGQKQPTWWGWNKRFSKTLPFKTNTDYTQYPPNETLTVLTDQEFLPLMVLYKDQVDGDNHEADQKWHKTEELNVTNEDLTPVHSQPLDNALGVHFAHAPNLYFAQGHFDDADESNHEPELDYENMMVVGMLETDVRQQIVVNTGLETTRKLKVDVNSARYIMAMPNQVIGVDGNGGLLLIADDPKALVIHNDNDDENGSVLQAIATQALAWYGQKRQAVEIPIRQIGYYCDVGAMLTEIDSVDASEPIGTPVTSVTIDFMSGTTTVSTGYCELDFVSLTGRKEDMNTDPFVSPGDNA